MISRSWKKFLSSREGVAALGTLARLANTYTASAHTRTGARRVPAPAAFPWGDPAWRGRSFVAKREAVPGSRARGPTQARVEEKVSTAASTARPFQLLPPCRVSRWVPVACLRPSSPAEQTPPGCSGCRWLEQSSAGTRPHKSRSGQRVCIFGPG